jgi:hypothetical protein
MPAEGICAGDLVLRFPVVADVDALLPAFADPELREAGNLPAFGRDELAASLADLPRLAETGRLMPLAAVEMTSRDMVGAGIPPPPRRGAEDRRDRLLRPAGGTPPGLRDGRSRGRSPSTRSRSGSSAWPPT